MLVEKPQKQMAYTLPEVAQLLNLSLRKVVYLVSSRELRSFRVGKSRRVSAETLEEFIKKSEKATS